MRRQYCRGQGLRDRFRTSQTGVEEAHRVHLGNALTPETDTLALADPLIEAVRLLLEILITQPQAAELWLEVFDEALHHGHLRL